VRFAFDGIPIEIPMVAKLGRIASAKEDTVLVGICGIPRSGKSILSFLIKRELENMNLKTLHIHLDDWILPRSQRRTDSLVEERTQVQLYPRIIENLLSGKSISAPGYDPASRELTDPFSYRINQEKIVILDGILSCHELIRDRLDFSIYVDCSEDIIKERCQEFYRWKGEEDPSIERLIKERSKEEWPTVRAQYKFVDEVFTYDQYSDTV
jgi:uridine kinase